MARQEFDDLESSIREFLEHDLKYARLREIVRSRSWFPALFVLYASEWWRREYDGSGWSWEPILLRLGAPSDGWTQAQRSECVEVGLAAWKIPVAESRGFRFLGSVALQGGLPMKLLAAAHGNIGWVLSRTLRLSAGARVGESEIEEWIRNLSGYLPHTYRQAEIFRLLAQIITTVLALKRTAVLDSAHGAIDKLDACDPDWRQRFPLPIEDSHARGLIEQLVKDAATARPPRSAALAAIDRTLERNDDWQIRSTLELPEYVEPAAIVQMFGLGAETTLPRVLVLRFRNGERIIDMGARKLAGRETYRIDRRIPELRDDSAICEHMLSLVFPDGSVRTATVTRGEFLHSDLPWLFDEPDGTSARFVRQGAGVVTSPSGLVCIPAGWKVEAEPGAHVHSFGAVPALMRTLWQFKGSVRVYDPTGAAFKCRSGHATADDEYLGWFGTRVSDVEFISPSIAFRGAPKLGHISEHSSFRSVSGTISWKAGGQRNLSSTGLVGPVEATWPAHGDVQWRSRIVLLGDAKPVLAESGDTPCEGKLEFAGWDLAAASTSTPDVLVSTEVVGNSLVAAFRYAGIGAPPEWCDVELLWRGNPNSAKVRLPFPAWGARCFDTKGRQLPDDVTVSTENLFGIRLVAFLGRTDVATLTLVLSNGNVESDFSNFKVPTSQGATRVEVRLIDYLSRIRRMLANADERNAFVRIELQVGTDQRTSVRVARHACGLLKASELQQVHLPAGALRDLEPDEVARVSAVAIRLNAPGDEPKHLSICTVSDDKFGWEFPVDALEAGPWLIYPAPDSPVCFRPMLWTVGAGHAAAEPLQPSLSEIMQIVDEGSRADQLHSAVGKMSRDFGAADWQVVEQFARQLFHLPFSTLDFWRVFAKSQGGLAALALRAQRLPKGFLERFSIEMPVVWETVPLATWVEVMRAHVAFEKSQTITTADLSSRVEEIASLHPALRVLLEIAETVCTGVPTESVRFALNVRWDFARDLFGGENSPYQQLLREGANKQWDTELQLEIIRARNTPLGRFFHPVDFYHREAAVNLPILLATSAATSVPVNWTQAPTVRLLRKYQDFCPEWFAEAFDLTVARCISENVIERVEG